MKKTKKKDWLAYGHFYTVETDEFCNRRRRSVLEIVDSKKVPKVIQTLSTKKADAVVIMMNPGSSQPAGENNEKHIYKVNEEIRTRLVPAIPDKTQEKIMSLMEHKGWSHVRVINLSDLRHVCSNCLYRSVNIEKYYHSIFHHKRSSELESKLNRIPGSPLIIAWGVDKSLDPLISLAMKVIANEQKDIIGIEKPDEKNKYYHPLCRPTIFKNKKTNWLKEIKELLDCV